MVEGSTSLKSARIVLATLTVPAQGLPTQVMARVTVSYRIAAGRWTTTLVVPWR